MYKTLEGGGPSILLYGSENWILTKKQASHLKVAEIKFLRSIAAYILQDHRRNTNIWHKLHIMSIQDRITQCNHLSKHQLEHLNWMDDFYIPKYLWIISWRDREVWGIWRSTGETSSRLLSTWDWKKSFNPCGGWWWWFWTKNSCSGEILHSLCSPVGV